MPRRNSLSRRTLTSPDAIEFNRLKDIVSKGQHTFVEVGHALLKIREKRYYLKEAHTFEEFCQQNWGWGASRARQICRAVAFWEDQHSKSKSLPTSERQARVMMSSSVLPGDEDSPTKGRIYFIQGSESKRIKIGYCDLGVKARLNELQVGSSEPIFVLAFKQGSQSEESTLHKLFKEYHLKGEWFAESPAIIDYINKNCTEYRGNACIGTANIKPDDSKRDYSDAYTTKPATRNGHLEVDGMGFPIPAEASVYWARKQEVQDMLTALSKIKGTLKRAEESNDPMYREVSFNHAFCELDQLYGSLKAGMPYAVCQCVNEPGYPKKDCRLCYGRGLLSEFRWRVVVPEVKAARQKEIAHA